MIPSLFHVPPSALGASNTVSGGPPAISTVLSFPPAKKARDRLSAPHTRQLSGPEALRACARAAFPPREAPRRCKANPRAGRRRERRGCSDDSTMPTHATPARIAEIHLAHAAGAYGGDDFVRPEASAGRKTHELFGLRAEASAIIRHDDSFRNESPASRNAGQVPVQISPRYPHDAIVNHPRTCGVRCRVASASSRPIRSTSDCSGEARAPSNPDSGLADGEIRRRGHRRLVTAAS